MEIVTGRCVIRLFREEDLDRFMAYRNDEAWMRYQGFKGLSKEVYRKALLEEASPETGMQYAVACRGEDTLLGDLYLKRQGDTAWIGYTISPGYARRGYAGEAVTALVEWLAQQGVAEVKAGVLPGNTASIGLLQKLGFAQDGQEEEEWVYTYRLKK